MVKFLKTYWLAILATIIIIISSINLAIAADLRYSCSSGSTNSTCNLVIEAVLNNEQLTAEFNGGSVGWCNGWTATACNTTGTIKVVNGEFTPKQLQDLGIKFKTVTATSNKNEWFCSLPE